MIKKYEEVFCDRCGKEIKDPYYSCVFKPHNTEESNYGIMGCDLCIDCVRRIFAKDETKGEA